MEKFKIFTFSLSEVQAAQEWLNKYPEYTIRDIHYYNTGDIDMVRFTLENLNHSKSFSKNR